MWGRGRGSWYHPTRQRSNAPTSSSATANGRNGWQRISGSMEAQRILFDIDEHVAEAATSRSRQQVFEDYDGFVEKFKPKKTTDDCYTPPAVYDAILGWLQENVDIEGREIVRTFYPGCDFERFEYPEGCVVVDNPPFSIITKICRWYMAHKIDFFLFAPHLTLFSNKAEIAHIVTFAPIIYENGANVKTDFVSNLFGDIRVMTAPELRSRIVAACKSEKTQLPIYRYPNNVTSAALLGKIAPHVDFVVRSSECRFISRLDSQKGGSGIFGGGVLLSNAKAAEKAAAEKAAAEKAAERESIVWELSDRERRIIDELSKYDE